MFNRKSYFFIGIGGIGISAIAKMLFKNGKNVSGSDANKSEITDDLKKMGIRITIGHKASNIPKDTEIVIHTIAINSNNPEILEAKKRKLKIITYPEALGELSKEMFTIAVSGTHGKTTTTAMIGYILKKAGLDPTIIVGSKILGENTNFISGKSQYLVVEACEYRRSFLNLRPNILVITNIEADHLDYYKNIKDIQNAFQELINKVPKDGYIITKLKGDNIEKTLKKARAKILDYDLVVMNQKIGISGEHNILNAQAAIKAVEPLGIDKEKAIKYLKDFKGTWRRLEYKGKVGKNIFYDDYAHHPTEIKASISTLSDKYPNHGIICVFEPHQQSRTRLLLNDFVKALRLADKVFIAPILITREIDDHKTTNKMLAEIVNKYTPALPVENHNELKKHLLKIDSSKPLCVVLMGAGNIYKWTKEILK